MIYLMDPDDLVFTVRNVERRRALRDRLRAKENAFELAPTALFACDRDGAFTEVNQEFLDMFELAGADEARARRFEDFFTDAPLPADFAKALEGEVSVVNIIARGDGEEKQEIEIRLGPSKFGNKIAGVVGSVTRV